MQKIRRRSWSTVIGLVAVAMAALVVAGCGGGGSSSSSSDSGETSAGGGSSSATAEGGQALAFSECMRENGVPEFPDPTEGGIKITGEKGGALDPESPAFQSAMQACESLAPEGGPSGGQEGELESQLLAFAECMRENGVPSFPDPEVSGGRVTMKPAPGVKPDSPEFKEAEAACGSPLEQGTP